MIAIAETPGCCWSIHMAGFPSEPPVYDSLLWHYPTLDEALEAHLAHARKHAEEQELPYLPETIDEARELVPVGFTQLAAPCRETVCECGANVHLQPGDRFECYMCGSRNAVIGGAA